MEQELRLLLLGPIRLELEEEEEWFILPRQEVLGSFPTHQRLGTALVFFFSLIGHWMCRQMNAAA